MSGCRSSSRVQAWRRAARPSSSWSTAASASTVRWRSFGSRRSGSGRNRGRRPSAPIPTRAIHLAVHKLPGFLLVDPRRARAALGGFTAGVRRRSPLAGRTAGRRVGRTHDADQRWRVGQPRPAPPLRQPARSTPRYVTPRRRARYMKQLLDGVTLDEGPARVFEHDWSCRCPRSSRSSDEGGLAPVRIGEGCKREVRRLLHAGDYHVERLVSTRPRHAQPRWAAKRAMALRCASARGGTLGHAASGGNERPRQSPSTARRGQEEHVGSARAAHRGKIRRYGADVPRADPSPPSNRGSTRPTAKTLASLAGTCRIEVERPLHEQRSPRDRLARCRDVTKEAARRKSIGASYGQPARGGPRGDAPRPTPRGLPWRRGHGRRDRASSLFFPTRPEGLPDRKRGGARRCAAPGRWGRPTRRTSTSTRSTPATPPTRAAPRRAHAYPAGALVLDTGRARRRRLRRGDRERLEPAVSSWFYLPGAASLAALEAPVRCARSRGSSTCRAAAVHHFEPLPRTSIRRSRLGDRHPGGPLIHFMAKERCAAGPCSAGWPATPA